MSENPDGDKKASVPSQRKCHFLCFNLLEVLPTYNEKDENEKSVRTGHLTKCRSHRLTQRHTSRRAARLRNRWLYKTRFGVVFVFAVPLRGKAAISGGSNMTLSNKQPVMVRSESSSGHSKGPQFVFQLGKVHFSVKNLGFPDF